MVELLQNSNIIILDIDGTIIGEILSQLLMYELNIQNLLSTKYTENLIKKRLNDGILRPFFTKFIQKYNNKPIFIYTASENQWAKYLIPIIESIIKFKFQRPLFTKNHCYKNVEKMKSCGKILELIQTTLNNKKITKEDLVIIENNPNVYRDSDKSRIIPVKTYEYEILENIPCYINEKKYNENKESIIKLLDLYFPSIKFNNSDDYDRFQKKYYKYYSENLGSKSIKDSVFKDFLK